MVGSYILNLLRNILNVLLGNIHQQKLNHPSAITKEIPKAIVTRISYISSSEFAFNESIPVYSDALRKSGFHDNITFIPKLTNTKTKKKKTRKCKIVWFNSPHCLSVKTNIGRIFLKLKNSQNLEKIVKQKSLISWMRNLMYINIVNAYRCLF